MTEDGLFDVQIWGTVGQWFAAVGTIFLGGLSLWLSWRGNRKSAELERQSAIRSLSFVMHDQHDDEHDLVGAEVVIFNAGPMPMSHLSVRYTDHNSFKELPTARYHAELRAGVEWKFDVSRNSTFVTDEWAVQARDVNGRLWKRSISGAITEIKEPGSRRRWQFWRREQ